MVKEGWCFGLGLVSGNFHKPPHIFLIFKFFIFIVLCIPPWGATAVWPLMGPICFWVQSGKLHG